MKTAERATSLPTGLLLAVASQETDMNDGDGDGDGGHGRGLFQIDGRRRRAAGARVVGGERELQPVRLCTPLRAPWSKLQRRRVGPVARRRGDGRLSTRVAGSVPREELVTRSTRLGSGSAFA